MLLGSILERFDSLADVFVPVDDGAASRCFISESYDATSHFETAAADIMSLYKRVTGDTLGLEGASTELANY